MRYGVSHLSDDEQEMLIWVVLVVTVSPVGVEQSQLVVESQEFPEVP